jgi:hypothetical protein
MFQESLDHNLNAAARQWQEQKAQSFPGVIQP